MTIISPQEQETLSAYLDNALNSRERQRLETQLQTRPELRAALNDLRQTQYLLRQAPTLRAPRNFTLTPEMAGLRTRPARVYPAFQWGFALAMFLFVAVLGGEVFFGSPAAMPEMAMAPAADSFAIEEESPVEEAPLEALESAPAEIAPDARNMGENPVEESDPGIAESGPALEETPTPGEFIVAAEPATPTAEATFKNAPTEEVFPQTIPTEPVQNLLPSAEELMTMTVMSEQDATMGGGDPMASDTANTGMVSEPGFWDSPWRVPQVSLAAIILLTGVGLLVFRRKTML